MKWLKNNFRQIKTPQRSAIEQLMDLPLVPFDRLLQCYPPFLFLGIRIRISKGYRSISLRIPLRAYFRNNSGVMFGGAMTTASDPFPALLLQKIIPNTLAYTKSHQINYLRPAYTAVEMALEISEDDVNEIKKMLESNNKAEKVFSYTFKDMNGKRVAKVTSTAYLLNKV